MCTETNEAKEIKKKIYRYLNDDKQEIVKLCSDMIKIPSENPPGDMSEVASFIRSWLNDHGFIVDSYEPEKGRVSLVTTVGEEEKPALILNGHMDVVPAGDLKSWKFPPYCGEVKEGKILGRGASDMKGGLTSAIAAFVAISNIVEKLPGRIILTAVPDEETGGVHGAGWLVENDKIRGDACLIGEPTGLAGAFIGEKGICWLRLEAKGVPAHGSLPMLGENAIEKLTRALPIIHKIEEKPIKIPEDVSDAIQISKSFWTDFVRSKGMTDETKLKMVANALDHPTVNIGIIKGGTKANVVPESCVVDVDIRVPPGITPEEIRKNVMELLEEADLADIKCKLVIKSNSNYTPLTEKIYNILKQNAREVVGIDIKPLYATAATDGRYLRLKGTPVINYGPGDQSLAHAYNEYVEVENIIQATKVIAGTAIDFLNSQ